MTVQVTRTKIILPRRRSELLTRQRLIDLMFDLMDYKLVILAAPAGYGKTSLLIDFAYQVELPVCWYALDNLDCDPQRFIAHLIAALQYRFPSFGKASSAALEAANPTSLNIDQLVTTIINDAYENIREHFLIVLDDYHLVNECKDIDRFLNRFIQEIDENCHLVLSSRSLLTIPDLPILVARSQVGGLSFEELVFEKDEIQALVLQNYHIPMPDPVAEELAQETEGWVTGLLLSAQTMWQGMTNQLRVARVSGVGLYDYLAQQVLNQQPERVREFLLQTSLLEEFDEALCREVFGDQQNWGELIDILVQNNLFVLPVGEDGGWIRYHHLFRDFLQARIEQIDPYERKRILLHLASVYASHEDWEKAYATYRQLGEIEVLADLIEQAGTPMFKNGRLAPLAEWIDSLPETILARRPRLLSLRGTVSLMQGQVERGIELLDRAESILRTVDQPLSLCRTLLRRAVAHRFRGNYQASLRDADEAQALLPPGQGAEGQSIQAEALRVKGTSLFQLGQLNNAIQMLDASLSLYRQINDRQNIANVQMELATAYQAAGHYNQALAYYQQALEFVDQTGNLVVQTNILNNLGVLHHLMGDYVEAGQLFETGLKYARQSGLERMQGYTLASIGDLYVDLEASEAALEAYAQARSVARKMNDRFLIFYLDLAEANQARRSGQFQKGEELLRSVQQSLETNASTYERGFWNLEAGRLNLSRKNYPEAMDQLAQAAQIFQSGGQKIEAARNLFYLANAHHQAGEDQNAFTCLQQALDLVADLESQHILVVPALEAEGLIPAVRKFARNNYPLTQLEEQVTEFTQKIPGLRRRLRAQTSAVPFAPPKLSINSLGHSQVLLDGKPVNASEWVTQKRVREFFFLILAHPDGLTKEAIGLVFWPDSSQSQLKLQFKNVIYRLRSALGQDVVLFDGDRYWFNRALDYEYDIDLFLKAIDEAEKAEIIEKKIAEYSCAVEYYQGDYLPDIDGSWVVPERERLWQIYLEATLELARLNLMVGQFNNTLRYCQAILVKDACQEEAHRLAMRAYAAKGNKAGIKRQFERCQQALLKEVNAKPSPQTETLYRTLSI